MPKYGYPAAELDGASTGGFLGRCLARRLSVESVQGSPPLCFHFSQSKNQLGETAN